MDSILSFFLAIIMAIVSAFCAESTDIQSSAYKQNDGKVIESVTMPLEGGSDPWFFEHGGKYYYCYSIGNGVAVRSSDKISTLCSGKETIAYRAPEGTNYSYSYWAPEMHYLNGSWYIYVAADNGRNENHRMYVLKGSSPSGKFKMIGKISDSSDRWAIDGTVLDYKNELYFIWSGWENENNTAQNLYIAHMSSPTEIDGERHLISQPKYIWEKKGAAINEGPEILKKNSKLYIIYSASGSWTDDYCLGMLSFNGGDILGKSNWIKSTKPVFSKEETAYGPGHCSFLKSKDGKTDYIVYHANVESGTGWNGRTIRIQPFVFKRDIPMFGKPLKKGAKVDLY